MSKINEISQFIKEKELSFMQLNPRNFEEDRKVLENMISDGLVTVGIEITDRRFDGENLFAEICDHHGKNKDLPPAIAQIFIRAKAGAKLKSRSVMVTSRSDLDSVGAMALAIALDMDELFKFDPNLKNRIEMISHADIAFTGDKTWEESTEGLPTMENPWPRNPTIDGYRELAAINLAVADWNLSLEDKVLLMAEWLISGSETSIQKYRDQAESDRLALVESLENGKVEVKYFYDIPFIYNDGRGDSAIGYALNCVYVAVKKNWSFGRPGQPATAVGLKYSIANAGLTVDGQPEFDFAALAETLSALEPEGGRWGGQTHIIGSDMGSPSNLSEEQIASALQENRNR